MVVCGITGHTGTLGKELLKNKLFLFKKFKGDITKYSDVVEWVDKNNLDLIIHLAAIVPTQKVNQDYLAAKKVNYQGTINLINAINKKKKDLDWLFFSSTSHVYKIQNNKKKIAENYLKKPYSKYGNTKWLAEKYIISKLDKRIPFCIGRIFSFTGKNQSKEFFIPAILKKIKTSKKKTVTLQNLNHYRDFISLEDIVRAITLLYKTKSKGIYNIGSGKKVSLIGIANYICAKYNKTLHHIESKSKTTYLIANIDKLIKLKFHISNNIFKIIDKII